MTGFEHITRCISVTDRDLEEAVRSRASAKALLEHLAKIAKPNEGAPKILLVFARMASTACDWLDGELRVELVGDGELSVVESMTELGGGLRERALPSFPVNVPLSEFIRAVERVPRMIEPLYVKSKTDRRLILVTTEERAARSLPPMPVAIAEEHLIEPPANPVPRLPPKGPPRPTPKSPAKAPPFPPRPGAKSPK